MDTAKCPRCGYSVGLGVWSEPGRCPSCDLPLMLTCELRALDPDEIDRLARSRSGDAIAAGD